MPTRRTFLGAGIGAAALILTACGGSSSPAPTTDAPAATSGATTSAASSAPASGLDDLVKAAKAEGALNFYTTGTASAAQKQADAFTAKYGIPTTMVRLTGGQFDTRFKAEMNSANGVQADIVFTTNPVLIGEAVQNGTLTALEKAGLPDFPGNFPKQFLLPDAGTANVLIQPAGIAYNTDLVKGDDVPKGWEALLDPKWKGKIAVADPKSALGYVGEWWAIGEHMGDDYLAKLGDQALKVYSAGSTVSAAVAAGEVALAGSMLVANVAPDKAKGAPIDIFVPDKTSGIELSVGMVAKAAHPNAAKLYALYCLSEEGAQILADASSSVSPHDVANLPKDYVPADIAKAPSRLAEIQKLLQVG